MRRLTLTTLIGLTLLTTSAALAAGPKLTVAPRFGAALMPGYDQPVIVTVTNPADGAAFTGEVVLRRGQQSWSAPVSLPAGAAVASVNLTISSPNNSWYPITATLVQDRGGSQSSTWNPPTKPSSLLRVLVVTSDGSLPSDWAALDGKTRATHRSLGRLEKAGPRRKPNEPYRASHQLPEEDYLSVVTATPTQLTERAGDLDQFGIIALVGKPTLSAAQSAALLRWVSAGGTLIPADDTATDPSKLVERYGSGRIRRVGLEASAPLTTSWSVVGALRAAQRSDEDYYYSPDSTGFFPSLLQSTDVQAPPFSTVALFLGAYLFAVVPLQYLILRRLDKREWAWGTTPLLAGAFAIGAYAVGSQGRSREAFYNSAAVVETAAGQTTGNAVVRYGLYSPSRATYTLTAPTADSVFFRSMGDISNLSVAQVPGLPTRLDEFNVPQWAMRSVAVHSNDLPLGGGVVADIREVDGQLKGTVTNKTSVTLENITVRLGNDVARIEKLSPGQIGSISVLGFPPGVETMGNEELRRFYPMLSGYVRTEAADSRRKEAILTAYTAEELVPLALGGGTAHPKTTNSLLIVHVPLK